MKNLTLKISPCPNDTFMFDAIINKRIDTEGLSFDVDFSDIEELNRSARSHEADITKASYSILPLITTDYVVSNSGSALGRGNGPLLVSRKKLFKEELADATIAIPGEHTTANLLLKRLFPQATQTKSHLFSDIATVIADGEVDAGILIHEGRFTYKSKGLSLVADLGAEWENRYSLPLPLGMIAVSRRLPKEIQQKIDRVLRRSVEYAIENPNASYRFVKEHAQELSDEVLRSHITLFVNEFSIDLGEEGRNAIQQMFSEDFVENQLQEIFIS